MPRRRPHSARERPDDLRQVLSMPDIALIANTMSSTIALDAKAQISVVRYNIPMKHRIKEVREEVGLSQEAVANAIGLHVTNYNKLENGHTDVKLSRLLEIADVLGVNYLDLLERRPSTRSVEVVCAVEAGSWREMIAWDEDDKYAVSVPDKPAWRSFKLYGAEVRGRSMARQFPPGSVIVFAEAIETRESRPQPGSAYVVDRRRGEVTERTLKLYKETKDGRKWLVPDTDEPGYQDILIDGQPDEEIRIVGRVLWAARSLDES